MDYLERRLQRYRARGQEQIDSGAVVDWPTTQRSPGTGQQWSVEVVCKCGRRRRVPLNTLYLNSALCRSCARKKDVCVGLMTMSHRWFDSIPVEETNP